MDAVTLLHLEGDELRTIAAGRPLEAWPRDVTRAYLLRTSDGSEATVLLCFRYGLLANAAGGAGSAELSHDAMAEQRYEVIREFACRNGEALRRPCALVSSK